MQDILIKPDTNGLYDIELDGADFASVEGFETAIPVSLFTDSRAPAVQVQEPMARRGWIGNLLTIDKERELGGLLWLLEQARMTEDTINLAQSFAQEALQWMMEDTVAGNVYVIVEKTDERTLKIFTTITTLDNTVLRYVTMWRSTDLTRTV